eukprot:TRINITY_DN242_c0_g1_i2.p1 TRINITY_DN242_c0_g1~~TRINITY_DN242_c0_g1_i2.p1  ORF type:complete len:529 (+),score=148.57 TRINITY_DN242_c0_g1_i2:62-1648(+)
MTSSGISIPNITSHVIRNPSPAYLYEIALKVEKDSHITSSGALTCRSGSKCGRSPKDKRIVEEPSTSENVWWGPINMPNPPETFQFNRERALAYLNSVQHVFVIDAYAGWDKNYRMKVRVICSRAYHALFMRNMLVRPTDDELKDFGEPDFTIYNAGEFPASSMVKGVDSKTSVSLNFAAREMVVLGTQYAGEMKKGVFTIMNYYMPLRGQLSLHSSCNHAIDDPSDVAVFFGLSGTGKTTLSADPRRNLIGDDEHVWTQAGMFNIEGGCYAKCIGLKQENEPEIFNAIKFGSILENVVYDEDKRIVDFNDTSITENTRCAYPIEYIPNATIPCIASHPKNIILLTCDAFGVLPPVSKLSPEQVQYHFINGYTAKVAGTEEGVKEPQATFSSCFGAPFLVWHPTKYADILAEKMKEHKAQAWLINTGWTGGAYGVGNRMSLKYTRAIVDAIHSGELAKVGTTTMDVFGLQIPNACPNVPSEVLNPRDTWADKPAFDATLGKLASLFANNFDEYKGHAEPAIVNAGPHN